LGQESNSVSSSTEGGVLPQSDVVGGSAGYLVDDLPEQLSHLRLLRSVLAHTDVLIYAKDLQGRYILANRAMSAVLGLAERDVIGRTDQDLFPATGAEQYTHNDEQVVRSGGATRVEETLLQPDGTIRTFLSTKFPVRDESGVVHAVGGVSTDITESVRTRRELAASQKRWRALVDASPVSTVVFGTPDLRFLYANSRAAEVLGVRNADDLLGRSCIDVFPEESRARFRERLAGVIAGEPFESVRVEIVGFDGRRRTIEANAVAMTFDGAAAVQVELRDVTERDAAEEALRISEERFRMLWESAPVGVAESDLNGIIVSVNPALCQLVGRAADEIIGQSVPSLMTDDGDANAITAQGAVTLLEGRSTQVSVEATIKHPSGRPTSVLVTAGLLYGTAGEPLRFIATVMDLTARRRAEKELRANEVLLRTAFDRAPNGLLLVDGEGRLLQANPALCSLLGRTEAELKATFDAFGLVHPEDRGDLSAAVEEALASSDGTSSVDLRLLGTANQAHWLSVSLAMLPGVHGLPNILVQVHDIAERRAAHERLQHRATHDALTELPNRELLSQRVSRALSERSQRPEGQHVALLFIDLDGFKMINDNCGHQVGDQVLIEVARRLQHAIRPTDLVARFGGDEFVVLCAGLPQAEEADRIAERLRELIGHSIKSECGQVHVSASIGISHAVGDVTAEQLLGEADAAMYAEKHGQRRVDFDPFSTSEKLPA
jgi:diguanylate cyclase (GGDEF)-like protein/PAS domain S-box-containing protein